MISKACTNPNNSVILLLVLFGLGYLKIYFSPEYLPVFNEIYFFWSMEIGIFSVHNSTYRTELQAFDLGDWIPFLIQQLTKTSHF